MATGNCGKSSVAERAALATKRAERKAAKLPPPPEQGLLDADGSDPGEDPHASFRDQCLTYCDFNRGVMMQEVVRFVRGASAEELSILCERIEKRESQLPKRKRGRPTVPAEAGLYRGRCIAWWRFVEGQSWPQIAKRLGKGETNWDLHTVKQWLSDFAEAVRKAMPEPGWPGESDPAWINRVLANRQCCDILMARTGLPFRGHPEECARIVRELLTPRE